MFGNMTSHLFVVSFCFPREHWSAKLETSRWTILQYDFYTAIMWGWQDPYWTTSRQEYIAKAACPKVSYDMGYPVPFAHTCSCPFDMYINSAISRGENTDPLSSSTSGHCRGAQHQWWYCTVHWHSLESGQGLSGLANTTVTWTKMLDLGIWMIIQAAVTCVHHKRQCHHNALARSVVDAQNNYLSVSSFKNVFGRLRVVLSCIVVDRGGNSWVERKTGKLFRDATIVNYIADEDKYVSND